MGFRIKVGIIGGSGLDNPDILKNRKEKVVKTIFGEPSDALIEGEIDGIGCVLLARHGRKHTIMPSDVNYRANIWALKEIGCTHVIVSTATGSLKEKLKPGDIAIVDNFFDRTRTRIQTFYDGKKDSPKGVCHIPMEPVFCERTRNVIINTAKTLNIPVHESGTVVVIEGPRYSSKGESLIYQQWGCDIVNMTLVPEVVLAKEAGLCYASIALITDYDCWRAEGDKVNVSNVMETFEKNVHKVIQLIKATVVNIAKENWDDTIKELHETVKSNIMLPS